MKRHRDRRMDKLTGRWTDRQIDGRMERERLTNRKTGRQMDEQKDR